jgi:sugar phosphate isomerase/epimerase
MRLGYLTPYIPGEFANARNMGFDAVELRVNWNAQEGKVDAGADLGQIREEMAEHGVGLTALACYNVPNVEDAKGLRAAFTRLTKTARALGTGVIATMAYRAADKSVKDLLPGFAKSFGGVSKVCEDAGVRAAIEPWPGGITGYGPYRWASLAIAPLVWEMMFEAVPSAAVGLEYDPSHLYWQQVDYLKAIRDFGPRIHHVHAKDTLIDRKRLARGGVHASGWWRFTIPGLGEVDWRALFATLAKAGYRGDMAIEHEDGKFSGDRRNLGFRKGLAFLKPLVAKYRSKG